MIREKWCLDFSWKIQSGISGGPEEGSAISYPVDCRVFHHRWRGHSVGEALPSGRILWSHTCVVGKCASWLYLCLSIALYKVVQLNTDPSPLYYCRLAFALWILSLILYSLLIEYGAYATLLTGSALVMANVIWMTVRNPNELQVPFEDGFLVFHWGWTFWLCLATGQPTVPVIYRERPTLWNAWILTLENFSPL